MATTNYSVNYEDERFQNVEEDKQAALDNVNNTYNNMINESDQYYDEQKKAVQDYADQQSQLQQENTNLMIEQINQQKDKAEKDYTKEQKASYVDWQKQSNQYGANAEQMATMGLGNTGFSESSQVSMYNQYQGRVATARESFNQAVLNYDNSIKEAQLQNNSKLAEIAYNALQAQLELSLQGFQYKNQLIQTQLEQQQQTEDRYYSRWQDVLNQMNQENQFAESIRQYEQNYKLQVQEFNEQKKQFELSYNQQIKEFDESIRQFNEEMARLKKKDAEEYKMEIQRLELQKQQMEQAKKEAEREYQLKQAQLEEEKRQANLSYQASIQQNYTYDDKTYTDSYEVNTPYYQGSLNSDAKKYGTFSNGYQPKGISGHGTLKKSGDTVTFQTQTLSGQKQTVTQTIWKAEDGTKWYWEGRQNKYIKVSTSKKSGGGSR
jgi:hypothetical protein